MWRMALPSPLLTVIIGVGVEAHRFFISEENAGLAVVRQHNGVLLIAALLMRQ